MAKRHFSNAEGSSGSQVRLHVNPVSAAVSGTLTYAAGTSNPASLSADLTTGYATTFSAAANQYPIATVATPVNDTVNEEHETFTITINAGTGYVLGTPTTTTVTITDNDPPAAPSGLSLTAGSGKLSASWTKPAGPVTGYQLRYKQTTATDQTATTSGDPSTGWVTSTASITTTSGEITGLTNGTAYHVQVRATDGQTGTGNGYGAWSASRSGTPAAAASTDATLSALTASSATSSGGSYSSLSIGAFASGTTSYTATVANTVTHVKLTPTVNDSDATVKVGKQGATLTTVSSGSASSAIALAEGANAITVTVTAEDGTTTKSYTVTVTRGQSNDATLSGLTVTGSASAGGTYAAQTLSPAFAASTDLYTVNVAKDISHVKLTATTTDSGATMKVLDVAGNDVIASLAGGTASRALPVNPDRNILVLRVTAANGATKDHYVYVQRAAIPRNLCVEVGAHPNGSPMLLISIQDAEIDTTITYSQAVNNGVAENLRQFFQVKRSVDASWPARAGSDNWPAGSQISSTLAVGGNIIQAKCGGVDGTVVYDLTEPGVTYNVRAHHVNESTFVPYGESTPVKTVTTWNLPGKPTSVSATAVSQDHTKLGWRGPHRRAPAARAHRSRATRCAGG